MKIGLICPYSIAKNGGVQELVFDLYHWLRQRGYTVHIITPQPPELAGDTEDIRATVARHNHAFHDHPAMFDDLILLGNGRDWTSRTLKTTGQISAGNHQPTRAMLLDEKFDLLHFHEPWVPFLSAQMLQINARLPHTVRAHTVGTFHAALPDTSRVKVSQKMVAPYARNVLKYLDQLTAVSPAAAVFAQNVTNRHITIIPNGIDVAKFQEKTTSSEIENKYANVLDPGKKTILYIGRIEPRKGVGFLLSAFSQLVADNPNTQLIIAGDGSEREMLESFATWQQIPNVSFPGFISGNEKVWLMQHCDVFCSPALYGESFGIVLTEAMAAGTPIVAGNNSGYTAVLDSDVAQQSLVDPTDIDALTAKLQLFLHDTTLRNTWLTWAKTTIQQYDVSAIISRYEQLYQTTNDAPFSYTGRSRPERKL